MLYKYCTTEGFDILLSNRLKIGRRDDFNDPFELVFAVKDESSQSKIVEKTLQTHWGKYGIICLAESPDIIQMWAHYADKHKGIVVGFDEDKLVKDKEKLVDVCYRDKMVLLPSAEHITEKHIIDIIKRKETNWQYEKEMRIYARLNKQNEDGNYYYNDFLPSSITELYLGLKSNKSTEEKAKLIKQKKEYNHLKLYKIEKDKRAFQLIPKELSD